MSLIARFAAYAAAFEKSYESDDWSFVEPFFAQDAVYDTGIPFVDGRNRFEGRPAVLGYFKAVLDAFDRRFDARELALLEGPSQEGQTVRIRGSATYRAAGVPDFVLVLEEIVTFDGDLIVHLEDVYDDATKDDLERHLAAYGEKLGIARAS